MKHLRQQAEAAQSAKLHRLGATGSLKMARKGEHALRKYAAGGAVSDTGPVEGMPAKGRLDRPGRSKPKGKAAGKKGTTVNIVIAGKGDDKGPMPMPMPPDAGPMPPPGPGGPPMPMRAKGGRVNRADGGSTISEDSKREAKRLRDESPRGLGNVNALSTGLGLGAAVAKGMPMPVKALGAAVAGLGAKRSYDDSKKMWNDSKEASRIEKGQVKEGEEDRKSGGRVKMRPMKRNKGGRSGC